MAFSDDGDDMETSIVIDYRFEVRIVRIVGNTFTPSILKVRAEVAPDDDEATNEDIDFAFTKIKFWFDTFVGRCVAVSRENELGMGFLLNQEGNNRTGNHLMVTPYDPTDDHLAALFQSKMNALVGASMAIGVVTVRSDSINGLSFTILGNAHDVLPDADEWLGEHNYFVLPWWMRDDSSSLDVRPSPETDVTKVPGWAASLDFLRTVINPVTTEVIRPEFKPKIIEGGKKRK